MNGKDHFDRVRCNWCNAEFDEEYIKTNEKKEEYCPVCHEAGYLVNTETLHCHKCGYHLALSKRSAEEFKETHSDGEAFSVYGEDYYLYQGHFYCQECWDEMGKVKCVHCGELVEKENCTIDNQEDHYCEECHSNLVQCEECSAWGRVFTMVEVEDGKFVCEKCHNEI